MLSFYYRMLCNRESYPPGICDFVDVIVTEIFYICAIENDIIKCNIDEKTGKKQTLFTDTAEQRKEALYTKCGNLKKRDGEYNAIKSNIDIILR